MKNMHTWTALALSILLSGCGKEAPAAWEAEREMKAYVSPKGDAQIVKFVILKRDICVPGKEIVEKVFSYTQVICPRRGIGWVADPYFKIYDLRSPDGRTMRSND